MGRIDLPEESRGFKQDPGYDIPIVVPRERKEKKKKREEREKID